ncbi:relaxase/mobilization nuclease domain-containing protein [Limosilactobacillus oris]|uniref:relaxase/mobilization nuclease domain-containing protein n=1 Tax=Limosilactobacillus oris TaxID=1632 RepID=UPI003208B080
MSILQTHSCHSSYNRLKYVFNEPAHSYQKTDKRVLAATGFNIKMLHDNDGRISVTQNGAYLERQFRTVLKRAHNPKRRYQAQTIIISFDPSEFDTSDLKAQSQQALQLVQHYVRKHFADCQSAIAIQSDGEGGKLHAHVVMNTIRPSGKTVATNRFNIQKLRKDFDEEMQTNYQKVTGRQWTNPIHNQSNRQDIHNMTTKSEWQQQLKELINQIKVKVDNIADFLEAT